MREKTYPKSANVVKSRQIHVCRLTIGGKRQRVCADFSTVMLLVRLAMGAKQGGRA